MILRHVCEVCGKDELLESEEAHAAGWDYPPKMGAFGVVSPRTCGGCPSNKTLWWRIAIEGLVQSGMDAHDFEVLKRIIAEPESITP